MTLNLTALLMSAALLGAADDVLHLKAKEPTQYGPTAEAATNRRLDDLAQFLVSQKASAPRIALFDGVAPQSADESEAVGDNAIVQIVAVTADPAELPIKAVYAQGPSGKIPLNKLVRRDSIVKDDRLVSVVGRFREDSYFLLPLGLAQSNGTLLVDFAINRTDFELGTLDIEIQFQHKYDHRAPPPRLKAVAGFLAREYPDAPPLPKWPDSEP